MIQLISKYQNGGTTDYTIQRGDTFGAIARKNRLTEQQLRDYNPQITNPDKIQAGQTLSLVAPVQEVKTIDGIRVPSNLNNPSIDLTPVNTSKFNNIVNQQGKRLFVDHQVLSDLDNYLIQQNVGLPQRQAILYNVVQEGSTTGDHGNGAYGYLGWRGERKPQTNVNQMEYLYNTIFGDYDANHWNHGGKGSGYVSGKAAQKAFLEAKDVQAALRALTYGYVRPDNTTRSFRSQNGYRYFRQGGYIKYFYE